MGALTPFFPDAPLCQQDQSKTYYSRKKGERQAPFVIPAEQSESGNLSDFKALLWNTLPLDARPDRA